MSKGANRSYEFGPYRMDPARNLLTRGAEPVPLTAKAFETLLVLIEHGDEVISKEELMKRLWPDTFVEEANLAQHISMVRKALGETPQERRYIITLPGRGYRFAEPVRTVLGYEGDQKSKQLESSTLTLQPIGAGKKHGAFPSILQPVLAPRSWVAVLVMLLACGLASSIYLQRSRKPSLDMAQQRVMLAVLPFANLSGDPTQEYFSDGLTEETITDLGKLNPARLGVIARTSAMAYKDTSKTVSQIGRELGVDFILEGSIRQEGGRARVSAQLIRVRDQTHLWAQNYDRQLSDLLEIENELGNTIAQEVQVNLSPQGHVALSRAPAVDPGVYDLYLKGRYYWNQRTEQGFWKGIEFFRHAIEKDPNYARAYAGLADSYILLGPNDVLPSKEVYPLARAAALKALELDDTLAEAHASSGFVLLLYDWNAAQAEKEFRRAIELDPNYSTAHHWYAYDLAVMKRFDEAISEMRRALQLDPLSPSINADLAQIFLFSRRPDDGIAQCNKTIELDPGFNQVYWYLGLLYEQKGMSDQSLDAFLKAPPGPANPSQSAAIRAAYRVSGIKAYWYGRLEMLKGQTKEHYVSSFTFAVPYARIGDRDKALENLEKAVDERYPSVVFVQVEPVFDNLRSDPRYIDLLHRIKLP